MILLFGDPDDRPLTFAIRAAVAAGIEYDIVDQTSLARVAATRRFRPEGFDVDLVRDGQTTQLNGYDGVYARPLSVPNPGGQDGFDHAQRVNAVLVDWLDLTPIRVVSRPEAMNSNGSKPFQAQLIQAHGLEVPATIVTNDPVEVTRFGEEHGPLIFKSTSGIRSIVRMLDSEHLARLDRVRSLPTQFQAHVEGVDVRVHVVGTTCFATEIRSSAIDYRYAHRDGGEAELVAIEIDESTRVACVSLAAALCLPLCGIDLRRRSDGSFVCFEVNPMPAFSYYESNTCQPIARQLVEFLAGNTL